MNPPTRTTPAQEAGDVATTTPIEADGKGTARVNASRMVFTRRAARMAAAADLSQLLDLLQRDVERAAATRSPAR